MTGLILDFGPITAPLDVKREFGAVGDGSTDDTVAIDAAFAASPALFFAPSSGSYIYNGAGYAGNNPVIVGAGRYSSFITLGSGCSLLTSSSAYTSLAMRNIGIYGGFGAIRHSYTGPNVTHVFDVKECDFLNYTGVAISTLASDMPYWKIVDCLFDAVNYTSTMGIVFAGAVDHNLIESCIFLRNRVSVKYCNSANNAKIHNCDFIRGHAGAGANPRVDLWFVPSVADGEGPGMVVSDCKLGNENFDSSTDRKVVYADEDTSSGTGHLDRFPDLVNDSTGIVTSHTFENIATAGGGSVAPFYSMTPYVFSSRYSGVLFGNAPTFILEFKTPPPAYFGLGGNVVGPWVSERGYVNISGQRASNDPNVITVDPGQQMVYDRPLTYPGGGDRTAYKRLCVTPINSFSAGSGTPTITPTTDSLGGTDAATIVYAAVGGQNRFATITAPTPGIPVWVEFDAQLGSSSPTSTISIYASDGTNIDFQRVVTPLAAWRRYRFLWMPRSAGQIFLAFRPPSGGTVGSVDIGRVSCYHAYEPVVHPSVIRQALRVVAYSASMTPDATNAEFQTIAATNTSAMTINAPTGAAAGQRLTIDFKNSSGGAHGTITMNAVFLLAGGGTTLWAGGTIANGKRRTATFWYDGTNWIETNRATADI